MATRTFGIGIGGLTTSLKDQSHAGFFGFGYSDFTAPATYQCVTKALTEASLSADQVTYGGDEDIGGFLTAIDTAELGGGELWFRYYLTAGADGATVSVDDVTIQITYETDVSGNQPANEIFLRSSSFMGVAIGAGTIVAVGASSAIWYSTDYGQNWNQATSPADTDYRDVVWSEPNKRFYACGTGGLIAESAEGITWQTLRNDRTTDFLDLATARGGNVVTLAADDTILFKQISGSTFEFYDRTVAV
jgi:hypothetical protein